MPAPSIEDVADTLRFELSADALDACRETANELATVEGRLRESPDATPTDVGEQLMDEYGALLAGYTDPRHRNEDGPLGGLDVAVKDNIAAARLPMTCGADTFEFVPRRDATVVTRVLDAGAALTGKANMDAFAFGPSGEFSGRRDVTNPIAPQRIPGGSSSGSGVAVAAGLVDAALGTDTGGSVRIPAACCGIVGMKPTYGTVPTAGVVPFAPSLDTVGPLAHDVSTAREVLHAIQGSDPRDETTGPQRRPEPPATPTVGLPTAFLEVCSPPVIEAVRQLREALQDTLSVQSVELDRGDIEHAYPLIGSTEFAWYIRQRGTIRGIGTVQDNRWRRAITDFVNQQGFSDHVARRVLPAAYLDKRTNGRSYVTGQQTARTFHQQLRSAFDDVDLLLVPTLRTLPHKRDTITAEDGLFDLLGNTAPFNLTGHPAVTLPIEWVDGLPVSVQLVAPRFADDVALAGAELIEQHLE